MRAQSCGASAASHFTQRYGVTFPLLTSARCYGGTQQTPIQQIISLLLDWMTWIPLTLQRFVISSHSAVMRYGKALIFAQGPAPQLELAFVHMLHDLHGHLISMLGHC